MLGFYCFYFTLLRVTTWSFFPNGANLSGCRVRSSYSAYHVLLVVLVSQLKMDEEKLEHIQKRVSCIPFQK